MSEVVGIVKQLGGTVTAISLTGSVRLLQHGDYIYANELISTEIDALLEVEFLDGSLMDLGRSSQVLIDEQVMELIETDEKTNATDEIFVELLAQDSAENDVSDLEPSNNTNEGFSTIFVDYSQSGMQHEPVSEQTKISSQGKAKQEALSSPEIDMGFMYSGPETTFFQAIESIDLSDVLIGEENGNLTDFLSVVQQGNDLLISIDPDGKSGVQEVVRLENLSLSDLGVVATDQAAILSSLVEADYLIVDQ